MKKKDESKVRYESQTNETTGQGPVMTTDAGEPHLGAQDFIKQQNNNKWTEQEDDLSEVGSVNNTNVNSKNYLSEGTQDMRNAPADKNSVVNTLAARIPNLNGGLLPNISTTGVKKVGLHFEEPDFENTDKI